MKICNQISRFFCLFCSVTILLMVSSCGKVEQTKSTGQEAKRFRIALIMKSLANEFFKTMEDGAKVHQVQHTQDYELLSNGIRNEQDVMGQNAMVEQMIAQKVDAIVIAPADSKALISVCKRAQDAGIVVVNIDNKFDRATLEGKQAKIPFVGPDNRKGARLAGEYLAKQLKTGNEVAIIEGMPGAFNGEQRRLGFEDAMKTAEMKIVSSQTARWEMNEASKVVGALLPTQPKLKALLCANDSMALGAASALRSANRLDVIVIGFDNISAAQELIKNGRMLCTVDQHGDKIAVFGIEYALEILRTKKAPTDQETPVDLITVQNLK
ncbi:MAG: sugar ABC transporter substrate-binding protein [Kiritimatiellae bacterium]|nr:sugar ABC transporter substrate-binding protein [Kiritimatiellia bacterium]MDD5519236.1 sugar ABC transporter substrate-binding protein [Kiritimatiellia bacterium]